MSRRPSKEDVLASYRREALLAAATRVFGERGFEGATMERIAEAADVAKGTTYLYYRSKQSIYDAALSHGFAGLEGRTREVLDRAPDFRSAISAFMTTRAEYFFEHRDFFRMYALAMARQVTRRRPRATEFQAMVDRQTSRLTQAVARAASRGEIRKVDAAATAVAIFDLTRGLVSRRMVSSADVNLAEDVAFLADLVWSGLAPAPAARAKRHQPPPSEREREWHPAGSEKAPAARARRKAAERARAGVGPREQ